MKAWLRFCATDPFVSRALGIVMMLGLYWLFIALYSLKMPVLP